MIFLKILSRVDETRKRVCSAMVGGLLEFGHYKGFTY